MRTHIWFLIESIFFMSANAGQYDHIPDSFYENTQFSTPSPIPSQAPPPDVIGMKEVVLFLTPEQVETLQGAGAVVRPYPEYKPGFDELQQQYQESIQKQDEHQYTTPSPNESLKLGIKPENYYKFLNIQQINDLSQLQTTESTTTSLPTTPRFKYTKSSQYYKDMQYLSTNVPKKVGRTKILNQNTNSENVHFVPNYENKRLIMVPYNGQPLPSYQLRKVQANIYQANNEAEQPIDETHQNINTQLRTGLQRNAYNHRNQKQHRNEYTQSNKATQQSVSSNKNAQSNAFSNSNKNFQKNEDLTNENDEKNKYLKAVDKIQQFVQRQTNTNDQSYTYTEANKASQRETYTTPTDVDQRNANTRVNDNFQHISDTKAINDTEPSAYFKELNRDHQSTKLIEETQRNAYFTQPKKNVHRNAYTQTTEATKQNNEETQRNAIKETERKTLKSTQLTTEKESEKPKVTVGIPTLKLTYPVIRNTSVEKQLEFRISIPESPVSPLPTVQTPSAYEDIHSLLLAPLYQHHTITDILARQKEDLLSSEHKIQNKLQQIKHAPLHNHREYTSELEQLTINLGQQNALAEIEAISKSPSKLGYLEPETGKSRSTEFVKNLFPVVAPGVVRIVRPNEAKLATSSPAPSKFIRPIPVPVLTRENDEVKITAPFSVNGNAHAKGDKSHEEQKAEPLAIRHNIQFNPIIIPDHVKIIRPLWEH